MGVFCSVDFVKIYFAKEIGFKYYWSRGLLWQWAQSYAEYSLVIHVMDQTGRPKNKLIEENLVLWDFF